MPDRYTQIVILCEDRQQDVFARHFLTSMGIAERHRIRTRFISPGKGSGEQYVREMFAEEVRTYRSRSSHLHIALAVLTDADILTVADRIHQLESALLSKSLAKREDHERIAFFIPKRNIETWIH